MEPNRGKFCGAGQLLCPRRRGPHARSRADSLCTRPRRTPPSRSSRQTLPNLLGKTAGPWLCAGRLGGGGGLSVRSDVPAARPWSGDTADVREAQRPLGRTGTALASRPRLPQRVAPSGANPRRLLQDVPDNYGLEKARPLTRAAVESLTQAVLSGRVPAPRRSLVS